jgi:hypothetical protein
MWPDAQAPGASNTLGVWPAAQVLGAKKKALAGFSAASTQPHQGFVSGCDVVLGTPPALRPRAVRLVAGKCALLARVDAYAQDPSGAAGAAMKARRCAPHIVSVLYRRRLFCHGVLGCQRGCWQRHAGLKGSAPVTL